MTSKAEYVRLQPQTRPHTCHWPGCEQQVPPAMWGCTGHWYTLRATLRAAVWRVYVPGQEVRGTPSKEYLVVARQVDAWIGAYLSKKAQANKPQMRPAPQGDLFGDHRVQAG